MSDAGETLEAMAQRPRPPDRLADEGVALIRGRSEVEPIVSVVLGSGLGASIGPDALEVDQEFTYEALPGFPPSAVPGHAGRLVVGSLFGVPAAVFSGRVHFYQGLGMAGATLVARLAASLGVRVQVVTNAAGGLDAGVRPGQLMVLRDHINLIGENPLLGWQYPDGMPAFVDLSAVYDPQLRRAANRAAEAAGIPLIEGVYAGMSGPSYETPAEVEALRRLGANAVGMSTVPEAVAGRALGVRTLGISCITNVVGEPTTHRDVLAAAAAGAQPLATILAAVLPEVAGGIAGTKGRRATDDGRDRGL